MGLFKKKKEKNQNGEDWITKMSFQEAMRELKEERENNKVLEKNLEVLQITIENIKYICNDENAENKLDLIIREIGE